MRRRHFLSLLGSAVTWPLASGAQQPERMRRVGVLMHTAADDPDGQTRLAAFLQGLQEAGWAVGRNVRVDTRWAAADADRFRSYTAELIGLAPDCGAGFFEPERSRFPKSNLHTPDCLCGSYRPGRPRFRRKHRPARRQHHRICDGA